METNPLKQILVIKKTKYHGVERETATCPEAAGKALATGFKGLKKPLQAIRSG